MPAHGTPSTRGDDARVLNLDAVRAAREQPEPAEPAEVPAARTCMLHVVNEGPDGIVQRQIGISDELTVSDLSTVIGVCFSLPEVSTPAQFLAGEVVLPPDEQIRLHLGHAGDSLVFMWGLWEFNISTAVTWPRDEETPTALCVGGDGEFAEKPLDLTAINATLTGAKMTRETLDKAKPEVHNVIKRSGLSDFVPLLQAFDLSRECEVKPSIRERLETLPRETSAKARDAYWSEVLALACLSAQPLTGHVAETMMAALGWDDGQGAPLDDDAIQALCAESMAVLEDVGVCGPHTAQRVDRVDLFRFLLKA